MLCRSFDGRMGDGDEGVLACEKCRKNQFDNSKQGKDAQPLCTAYLNFMGFIEGDAMPIVVSFAKTNYNEGKKTLSIAKSLRCSIWNYGYVLGSRQMAKDKQKWFILTTALSGETTPEQRILAKSMFDSYESLAAKAIDYEDGSSHASADINIVADGDVEI